MFANFALLLLINASSEVLLLRRINTPFCNHCYSLPGGAIARGETAQQTVIREAHTGLGLIITLDDLEFKHAMYRRCNEAEFFACFFQLNTWSSDPRNAEPNRHDDLQWFPVDQLPENIVPAHQQAIELIHKNVAYSEHGWEE